MTLGEVTSIASIAFGIGCGGVALYIRSTISDTIIQKLNGRYTGSGICQERHRALSDQLSNMYRQTEHIQTQVEAGFSSIRGQLNSAQVLRDRIAKHDVED